MVQEFSLIGRSLPRADAIEKVKGEAKYTVDLQLPRMLQAKFLRSPHAHARIVKLDTSRAEALSGVKAVLTFKNVPKVHPITTVGSEKFEYLLDETVHYAGEEVAAVAAETKEIAEAALKLIKVEYQVLSAVFDKEEAMKPDAPRVHPELKSNIYPSPQGKDERLLLRWGDIEKGFTEADYIIDGTYESPFQHHVSPEPRSVVCQWVGLNLTCWASTQIPQQVRENLAKCLSMPIASIRVIATYLAGGYGLKQPEKIAALTALLARKSGRPVKAVFTREEDFVATHHRTDSKIYARVGVKKDGTITALSTRMITNFGRDSFVDYLVPASAASDTCSMLYKYQNSRFEGYHVITNITDHGAMNGFGDPEAGFCIERLMDEAAERIRMDPVEFRFKNCASYGDRAIGTQKVLTRPGEWGILGPDINSFPECIRRVADAAQWSKKWKGWRIPVAVSGVKQRGIGIAIGMHHCAAYIDSAMLKMNADGTADVLSSAPEIGQGLKTAVRQVVAEVLGLNYEDVNVVLADTSVTPRGPGVFASRGTSLSVNAAYLAAQEAKRKLLDIAAPRLGVSTKELEVKGRRIYIKGQPKAGIPVTEACLIGFQVMGSAVVPHPFIDEATGKELVPVSVAATIAEVEVDMETGELEVLRITSAHDCGRAINPTIIENQIDLSLTLGNGWVRSENFIIDTSTGVVINPNLLDYKVMTILDMPKMGDMQEIIVEVPTSWGPFGAKGMSETATTTAAPAIANAIYNAIGVRIRGDHLTPDRILKALGKY